MHMHAGNNSESIIILLHKLYIGTLAQSPFMLSSKQQLHVELKFTIYHRAAEVCRHWQQASCIALGIRITDLGITLTAEVEESLEQTP